MNHAARRTDAQWALTCLCRAAAFLCAGWLALPVAAQTVPGSSAQASSALERCLLDALRGADPAASVASVRARCAGLIEPGTPAAIEAPPAAAAKMAPAATVPATRADTPILRRLADEARLRSDRLAFMPHRPNYLLPFAQGANLTGSGALSGETLRQAEFKFQVSLKLPLTKPEDEDEPIIFFAYTGQSWWQAYQAKRSSPFREYNHDPEIFVQFRSATPVLGWTHRLSSFGFEHTSNGQQGLESRSWNRLFAHLEFDRADDWWLSLRGWMRIPEGNKTDASDTGGDDNPGITRYIGNGELRFGFVGDEWQWNTMLRRSLRSGGKGAVEFSLSYPTGFNDRARWYLQYFVGYGESLIDYNRRIRRFGIGLLINDWY